MYFHGIPGAKIDESGVPKSLVFLSKTNGFRLGEIPSAKSYVPNGFGLLFCHFSRKGPQNIHKRQGFKGFFE